MSTVIYQKPVLTDHALMGARKELGTVAVQNHVYHSHSHVVASVTMTIISICVKKMGCVRLTQSCVVRGVTMGIDPPTPLYHLCGAHRQGPASHSTSCVKMVVKLDRGIAGRQVSVRTSHCLAMVSVCTRKLQETQERGSTVQTQTHATQVTRLVTTPALMTGTMLTCAVGQISAMA